MKTMSEPEVMSIEREEGFRILFEYASIGIVVINSEGQIVLANPFMQKMFDYENAELTGQQIEMLIPEIFRRKHVHHREKYFEKPVARPMGLGMEVDALKKDGHEFPVEISLGHYELDGVSVAVAFISDITKRSEAELKLKKMNEELENRVHERTLELTESLEREKELNEMKSRFVSMASHEFRTPLTSIHLCASLLENYLEPEINGNTKEYIDRILSSVQNLTDILNDFLSLDKFEQEKIVLEKGFIDLGTFVEDILEDVNGILKEGQTVKHIQLGKNEIFHDKKILRSVLTNLLSNAIKYSDINQEIILTSNVSDNLVTITVRDHGIGIPAEEQPLLFTKFFRARNAVNIEGTGLGLTIVRRLVELLNGTITLTSMINEGSTFIVEFPNQKMK